MLELFLGFLFGFWGGFFLICSVAIARESDNRYLKESDKDENK